MHIKLAELQPQIEEFVQRASGAGTWSSNGKAFTDGWLRGGLQSRGMTRDLKWGVPLPKELGPKWEGKVMYVWVSQSEVVSPRCFKPFFPSNSSRYSGRLASVR